MEDSELKGLRSDLVRAASALDAVPADRDAAVASVLRDVVVSLERALASLQTSVESLGGRSRLSANLEF